MNCLYELSFRYTKIKYEHLYEQKKAQIAYAPYKGKEFNSLVSRRKEFKKFKKNIPKPLKNIFIENFYLKLSICKDAPNKNNQEDGVKLFSSNIWLVRFPS